MSVKKNRLGVLDRLKRAFNEITNFDVSEVINSSVSSAYSNGNASSATDNVYKAVIPGFLYKPPFGHPLYKNIPEIRRMARIPHAAMVVNTICNEVAGLDWSIYKHEDYEDVVPDEVVKKTKDFFYNPNRNDESFEQIIRALVRDILEIDAGVVVKVRNLKDELMEIYVRDGGTFTKNPDIYGVMPDENAYYQYGWLTGSKPMPFDRNEVIYFMLNPRSDSIYGLSNIEVLMNTLQLLTYGIDANLEYFTDNNIPKGVFKMINANSDDIKSFKLAWAEQMKTKDGAGNWRKYFHKMPIINTDGAFERIAFSNVELEFIQQQEWFVKLVWACFNINPSELGFTDDSNRATDMVQASIFKRKLLRPLTQLLEYQFNFGIVNDLPWVKGKYENMVVFEFNKVDTQEDLSNRQLIWGDLERGLRTVNECREAIEYEPIDGGDELRTKVSGSFDGFNPFSSGSDEDVVRSEFVGEEEELPDFGLKSLGLKHKYVKRTGSPGDYRYFYRDDLSKVGSGVSKENVDKTKEIVNELDDLVEKFDDFTTSDLQGVVGALANKFGADEDKMLDYVYDRVKEKQSSGSVGGGSGLPSKSPKSVEDSIKDLRSVVNEVDTSDLQGITGSLANKYLGVSRSEFSESRDVRDIVREADDLLLNYAYGDVELSEVNSGLSKLKEEFGKLKKKSVDKKEVVSESKALDVTASFLEKELIKDLKDNKKKLLDLIKASFSGVGAKSSVNDFVKKVIDLYELDENKFVPIVEAVIKNNFYDGLDVVGVKLDRNFLPDWEAISFISSYAFDNVKGMNSDLKNDLRQVLERALMNGEGINSISKSVSKVFDVSIERGKVIARTESIRARNMGELSGWKQSGLSVEKMWDARIDDRTSKVCRALNGKWVDLNDVFVWEGQEFQAPPAHCSCRSSLSYRLKNEV